MFADATHRPIESHHSSIFIGLTKLVGLAKSWRPVRHRPLPVRDLSDRALADLNLRRSDVVHADPREPQIF